MTDFFFAALPIALLIFAMVKPRPVPSSIAFAFTAVLAYIVRLTWFGDGFPLLNAAVVVGLLDALTPIAILFGAIFFFVAMEKSGAMRVLQDWLKGISPNPIARIMLAGWSFIFLIEGAAGFGTPAALAAPVLVGLGFPPLRVAALCLIFNAIPTTFGAVGTPVWFAFEVLDLPPDTLTALSGHTALLQSLVGLVLPAAALRYLVPWSTIWRNLVFIQLSVLASVLPMFLVARFNYEFPAVVGGVVGLPVTVLLARFGIGLEKTEGAVSERLFSRRILLALSPLAATVAILLITRIPAFGLRQWLTASEPYLALPLVPLGTLKISQSLVLTLHSILGEDLHWTHALLYVPSLVPFVFSSGIAFALFRPALHLWSDALRETATRVAHPVIVLFGALVFVSLLMTGGDRSSTHILGYTLAKTSGDAWKFFAPFLGALGSFFSGSTTISNLTFGNIQYSIAKDTGMDPAVLLALQCAGAAMGNIFCIHNIVSVGAVLSLSGVEGRILKDVLPAVGLYGFILIVAAFFL